MSVRRWQMTTNHKKSTKSEQPELKDLIQILIHEIRLLRNEISKTSAANKVPHRTPKHRTSRIALNPSAKKLAIKLLNKGLTYEKVKDRLNEEIPGFSTSRSAVGRFWQRHASDIKGGNI